MNFVQFQKQTYEFSSESVYSCFIKFSFQPDLAVMKKFVLQKKRAGKSLKGEDF